MASLERVARQERIVPRRYISRPTSPARMREYLWAWLVNEDDWVQRLGPRRFQLWAYRLIGPLSCGMESVGACRLKDMGPRYPQCPSFHG